MKRSASLLFLILAACLNSLGTGSPSLAGPAGADRPDPLARFVILEEGKCSPLPDYCNCGNFRRQGSRCLFEVVCEADGTPVPGGRLYAATLDCGECRNNDPAAPGEKVGAVTLKGPWHPDVVPDLQQPYDDLIYWVKQYKKTYGGKVSTESRDAQGQERAIAGYKRKIAGILLDRCVGYYYQAVPEGRRIPLENFRYDMLNCSDDNAAMVTQIQFGDPTLTIYSDCFYDHLSLKPTPEVFCAALLHEIYHWQQEGHGAGSSNLEHIIYELACTEKMRLNSYYIWILEADRATKEFHIPQRDYWLPRFEKEWAKLDKAGQKKVAGWTWSRGGKKDDTPEDAFMRDIMYFRNGWFVDVWETLFKATELRIIRLPVAPLFPFHKKTP